MSHSLLVSLMNSMKLIKQVFFFQKNKSVIKFLPNLEIRRKTLQAVITYHIR